MRFYSLLSVAAAAIALQVSPAAAAPLSPVAGAAATHDSANPLVQQVHRRMRRGCRFHHGRIVCGRGHDRHRGHHGKRRHGDRRH